MAKKVKTVIKLQIPAGQANPAPPVGPALGQHGLNIAEFCQKFNEATRAKQGEITPVEITVFEDRTYTFITKTPPAAELLKKAAGIPKGSGETLKRKPVKLPELRSKRLPKRKCPTLTPRISKGRCGLLKALPAKWVLKLLNNSY